MGEAHSQDRRGTTRNLTLVCTYNTSPGATKTTLGRPIRNNPSTVRQILGLGKIHGLEALRFDLDHDDVPDIVSSYNDRIPELL